LDYEKGRVANCGDLSLIFLPGDMLCGAVSAFRE